MRCSGKTSEKGRIVSYAFKHKVACIRKRSATLWKRLLVRSIPQTGITLSRMPFLSVPMQLKLPRSQSTTNMQWRYYKSAQGTPRATMRSLGKRLQHELILLWLLRAHPKTANWLQKSLCMLKTVTALTNRATRCSECRAASGTDTRHRRSSSPASLRATVVAIPCTRIWLIHVTAQWSTLWNATRRLYPTGNVTYLEENRHSVKWAFEKKSFNYKYIWMRQVPKAGC